MLFLIHEQRNVRVSIFVWWFESATCHRCFQCAVYISSNLANVISWVTYKHCSFFQGPVSQTLNSWEILKEKKITIFCETSQNCKKRGSQIFEIFFRKNWKYSMDMKKLRVFFILGIFLRKFWVLWNANSKNFKNWSFWEFLKNLTFVKQVPGHWHSSLDGRSEFEFCFPQRI